MQWIFSSLQRWPSKTAATITSVRIWSFCIIKYIVSISEEVGSEPYSRPKTEFGAYTYPLHRDNLVAVCAVDNSENLRTKFCAPLHCVELWSLAMWTCMIEPRQCIEAIWELVVQRSAEQSLASLVFLLSSCFFSARNSSFIDLAK